MLSWWDLAKTRAMGSVELLAQSSHVFERKISQPVMANILMLPYPLIKNGKEGRYILKGLIYKVACFPYCDLCICELYDAQRSIVHFSE